MSGMLHRGQIKPKPSCETYLLMGSWKNGRKSAVEVLLIACNRTNKAEPGSAVFVATAKRPRATSSMSPLKWARLKTEVGEVDFPVYRLIHASANTSKATCGAVQVTFRSKTFSMAVFVPNRVYSDRVDLVDASFCLEDERCLVTF